ncbi:MAG: choice-of-anchor D domain-containing protein [Solirubrobacteraceae bacterium]
MLARKRSHALLAALVLVAASFASVSATARASAGQLLGSGFNSDGQLGDGTGEPHDAFAANPFLPPTAIEASAGQDASLVLLANGTVYGSGDDAYGELGDGFEYPRYTPEQLPGLSGVTAVSEGAYQSLFLLGNGTVEAVGRDDYGQLGNGVAIASGGCNCLRSPTFVDGIGGAGRLGGVAAISSGYLGGDALLSNGRVAAWGFGQYGDLGNGATAQSDVPVEVSGVGGKGMLEGVVSVSSGFYDSVALLSNGHVVTWGYNVYGELGDGSTSQSDVPVEVLGIGGKGKLEDVVAVSAGGDFDLALLADGQVVAWGYDHYGELGDGSTSQSDVPVEVLGIGGSGALGGIASISANAYSALATTSSHGLLGWGRNESGELGDGSYVEAIAPVVVPGVSGVVSLAHGDYNQDSLLVEGAFAQLSTSALGFAAQAGSASPPQSVVLANTGPAPLVVSGVVLSGSPAFSKSSDGCTGATLAPGSSCSVGVSFAPGAAGGCSGSLAFSSSAANALPTVSLGGVGAAPPPSAAAAAPPTPAAPALSIRSVKLLLKRGRLRIAVACANATCAGTARLTAGAKAVMRAQRPRRSARERRGSARKRRSSSAPRSAPRRHEAAPTAAGRRRSRAKAKKRRAPSLASGRYSVAGGARATIVLRLTRAARRLLGDLRRHRRLTAELALSVVGGKPANRMLKLS